MKRKKKTALARRKISKKNPLSPPSSKLGQVGAGLGLLATGIGVGYAAGYVPLFNPDKDGVAPVAYAVYGGFAATIAGGLLAIFSKSWRTVGLTAAGVGGFVILSAIIKARFFPPHAQGDTPGSGGQLVYKGVTIHWTRNADLSYSASYVSKAGFTLTSTNSTKDGAIQGAELSVDADQ